MGASNVERKFAKWEEVVTRTWTVTLDCGHVLGGYDDIDDAQKTAMERRGAVDCGQCARDKDELAELERRVKDLKARRRGPT